VTAKIVGIEGKRKEKEPRCPFCGSQTVHPDFSCPRISAVDFGEDWEPVRIEFHDYVFDLGSQSIEPEQETEESQT
jgi:hypothetical protein